MRNLSQHLLPVAHIDHYWIITCPPRLWEQYYSYTFNYMIDKKLRLNITFEKIMFPDLYGWCVSDNITVEQKFTPHAFTYCGVHSLFNPYPASFEVIL